MNKKTIHMNKKTILSLMLTICLIFTLNVPSFAETADAETIQSAEIGVWAKIIDTTTEYVDEPTTYNINIEWDNDDSITVTSEYNIETAYFNTIKNDICTVTVSITPGS